MALILNIDTSFETAGISIAENEQILGVRYNERQVDHASWIHNAIQELFKEARRPVSALQAVAVTSGPGSYTGLRVGMATAKGLCYALNIPLITETSFRLLASAVKETPMFVYASPVCICPMIDARRMEVFTVLYDENLKELQSPAAVILDENSLFEVLEQRKVIFCGNGSVKWQKLCSHPNALFSNAAYSVVHLTNTSNDKYQRNDFAEIAYVEPFYLKNVYTG